MLMLGFSAGFCVEPSEPQGVTQKRGQVQFYRAAEPGAGAKTRLRKRRAEG
jgi:hypothetical protein